MKFGVIPEELIVAQKHKVHMESLMDYVSNMDKGFKTSLNFELRGELFDLKDSSRTAQKRFNALQLERLKEPQDGDLFFGLLSDFKKKFEKKQNGLAQFDFEDDHAEYLRLIRCGYRENSLAIGLLSPVQVMDYIEPDYSTEFFDYVSNALRKRICGVNRFIIQITGSFKRLLLDKRAIFRSIVEQFFKNLDDEHAVLNSFLIPESIKLFKVRQHEHSTYKYIGNGSRRIAA
ncbi:hypothetical protein DBR40_07200 [Pedobacter sp. KBW01]|uniref:hypothetical protein n=1 Tax=Pedobacter sp. KBW01 TaxID=2153364 RepID=UPI000F599F10|nr:hypothetical protein [Pedobacter sp. KBW01]RQO77754.1 hypothetical protein DBR40_07200 [Pedobacter sp. KBW01]